MTDRDTITRTLSEGPWGGGVITLQGGAQSSLRPDTVRDNRCDYEVHEGRMQTGCRTAYAGSMLKPRMIQEGAARKASLPAVLGKIRRNGMIGGIEETSASFEARSAPRSYPTTPSECPQMTRGRDGTSSVISRSTVRI